MRKLKLGLAMLIILLFAAAMTGCASVQFASDLTINSDGTGTRSIIGKINKDLKDEYGITYYYLEKHGDELKEWLEGVYTAEVPGSEEWLEITVVDKGAWETVTLTFEFSSFEEHNQRLKALAYNEEKAADYVDPVITVADGKITEYKEDIKALTAIMNSIHTTFLADDSIYDNECTDEYGNSLTNGPTTNAESDGVALMDPEYGAGLTIKVDKYKSYPVYSQKEGFKADSPTTFTFTVTDDLEVEPVVAEPNNDIVTIIIISAAAAVVVIAVIVFVAVLAKKKKNKTNE